MPLPRLTTARLLLRPLLSGDEEAFLARCADRRVMRYVGDPLPREQAAALFRRLWLPATDADLNIWAVCVRERGAFIGHAGFRRCGAEGAWEILCYLDPPWWGQGFATEAVWRLVEHGFGTGGYSRIVATVDPDHEASLRLLRRLGFSFEAEARDEGGSYLLYSLAEARE